jgi:hypothetical protein
VINWIEKFTTRMSGLVCLTAAMEEAFFDRKFMNTPAEFLSMLMKTNILDL